MPHDLTCSSIIGSNSSTIYKVSTFEAKSSLKVFGNGLTKPSFNRSEERRVGKEA